MRVLSQGRLARRIAQALLAAFFWSIATMGAGTIPASAQISTRVSTAQSIAVVPFENLTTCLPETLGPKARALVSDELETRLMLAVLSSKDVDDTMAELGLTVPLVDSDLVRLATELEVPMVVTGKVTQAAVVVENGQRYAEVTLAVALFDRAAETTVNGAVVTARSPVSADASEQDLLEKALKQAVFLAVQEMKTRPTVTAMVLWAKGGEIFTNSGTRAGVTTGMYMVAIRGGQRIATVQITRAEATGSYGKTLNGSPLQTGDHLRAVYQTEAAAPGLLINRVVTGTKKASGRIEKIAIAAGVLLGLAVYASSANNAIQGNFSTNNLRAANLANGSALGVSGFLSFLDFGVTFIPTDPADPTQGDFAVDFHLDEVEAGATLITWEPPSGSQARRIAAYVVYRDDQIVGVAFTTEDQNWVIDSFSIPPGVPGATVGLAVLTLVPTTGQIATGINVDAWDPEIDVDSDGNLTFNPEYNDFVDSISPNVMNDVLFVGDTEVDIAWQFISPLPPNIYQYKVRPITIENIGGAGTAPANQWRFTRNNWTFTTAHRITSVAPPPKRTLSLPPVGQDSAFFGQFITSDAATGISLQMYKPLGADEMIVQVTRDQGDNVPISFQNNVSQTVTTLNAAVDGSIGAFRPPAPPDVVITPAQLASLPGDTNIFWLRVGARNRSDTSQPLVWPLSSELDPSDPLHFDAGWVWWEQDPARFELAISGTSSLSAMKKERNVLTNSRTGRGARIRRPNEGRELRIPR